jgi:excisionase family DNA binding protein
MVKLEYYKPKEMAALIGVNTTTIIRWIKKGVIPAKRSPAGDWWVVKENFHAFVAKLDYDDCKDIKNSWEVAGKEKV